MPTYEYECDQCGHAFEVFQRISDDPVRVCPECGKRKVRRLISSGGGIVFKGTGFYATDYRASPRPAEGSGKKSSSESAGSSDSAGGSSDSGSTGSDPKPKKTNSDD
ncbi:MAG: FmdB family zinc ribbon protein [Gemmatimonadota bacterium]